LGSLADPSKEAHESSLLENNKEDNEKDNKKDNKEEEKPPPEKLVNFQFSSMEGSAPPYVGLYPSLTPFQVDPQTGAIPNARTKWREETEDISLETTFRQLLLEDGNNDPSLPPLALSFQRTLWPFQSSWSLRDNNKMNPFLLRYLEDLEIQSGRMGLTVPTLLLYWKT
jgi:hypothetical protein